jgi:hypothetical protein
VSPDPPYPPSSVVWGNDVIVTVKGDSSGDTPDWGVPLQSLRIDGDGHLLTGSETALWAIASNTYVAQESMGWNTTTGEWSDGYVSLVAMATNVFGMTGLDARTVLLDNYTPNVPPSNVATVPTATDVSVPLTWTESTDGTLRVRGYSLTASQQGMDGAWQLLTPISWEPPAYIGTTVPTCTLSVAAFSRYTVSVRGCGPRWYPPTSDASWLSAAAVSPPFVSRPLLTGTGGGTTNHVLRVTPPSFATATTPMYTWYYARDPGTGWSPWYELYRGTSASLSVYHASATPLYRYRVRAEYVPAATVATQTIGTQVLQQTTATDDFSAPSDWSVWW